MPIKERNMTEQSAAEKHALLKRQLKRASTLDPELLECRVGGTRHRWVRCQPDIQAGAGQKVTAHQCHNCWMIKRMRFGAKYGEVISRTYEAPPGYYLKRGEDEEGQLLSSAAVRLALADRKGLPELVHPDYDN